MPATGVTVTDATPSMRPSRRVRRLAERRGGDQSGNATGTLVEGWMADFLDVPPSNPFHGDVVVLVRSGITAGCSGGKYCPGNSVTRAQMAVFLLRAEHGAAYQPPRGDGAVFLDVPAGSFAAAWIERLAAEGITGGCGGRQLLPRRRRHAGADGAAAAPDRARARLPASGGDRAGLFGRARRGVRGGMDRAGSTPRASRRVRRRQVLPLGADPEGPDGELPRENRVGLP
jgi:hypothetical protein